MSRVRPAIHTAFALTALLFAAAAEMVGELLHKLARVVEFIGDAAYLLYIDDSGVDDGEHD